MIFIQQSDSCIFADEIINGLDCPNIWGHYTVKCNSLQYVWQFCLLPVAYKTQIVNNFHNFSVDICKSAKPGQNT